MKKTIAILLVAIMAVGSAFATFSGSAQVGVGANFDTGEYGFIGNSTNVKFDVELATENVENVSEGDIYASVKASFGLKLMSDEDGIADGDPVVGINEDALAFLIGTDGYTGKLGVGIIADITEAKIGGANWYVSLLGLADVNDFAKSAIDTWTVEDEANDYGALKADYDKNATYKVAYNKAPGVEVGIYDFVVGVGFKAKAVQEPEFDALAQKAFTLYAKTPEFEVIDGLTIQAGATYATVDAGYADADKDINAFGASAKVAYASDLLNASVATDMGYDIDAEKFGTDVAANLGFEFVTVDAYYATDVTVDGTDIEDLLSLQAKLDLTGFNVPVGLTLKGKDLVNAQDLSATVDLTFGSFKVSPTVGYVVETETFKAGVAAEYVCDYFTAKAETNIKTAFVDDDLVWDASASIENTTLIPGATIKLAWSDAKDLLNNDTTAENEYGKIVASLKVEF